MAWGGSNFGDTGPMDDPSFSVGPTVELTRHGVHMLGEILLVGFTSRSTLEQKIHSLVIMNAKAVYGVDVGAYGVGVPSPRLAGDVVRYLIRHKLLHRRPVRANVPAVEAWLAATLLRMEG